MNYRAVKPHEVPPGGWRYKEPVNGYEWDRETAPVFGSSLESAAAVVAAHREGNGIEPGDAWQDVLDYTARALPQKVRKDHFREDRAKSEAAQKKRLTRSMKIRKAGVEALANIAARKTAGLPVHVPLLEAFRRAGICRSCAHNVHADKSAIEKFEDSALRAALGGKKLPDKMAAALGACEVCTCENETSVWFHTDVFADGPPPPAHCWKPQKKEAK